MKLSLCMIVRDEEAVLARCLNSVKPLVDEIVIVDTGSLDGTIEIAKQYADKIIYKPWRDNFAQARNFSFAQATGDYILWLDADDIITPKNAERFISLRKQLETDDYDTIMCGYESGALRYERERIVKRGKDAKWRGHVHECIPPFGKILHSDFTVTHLPQTKEKGTRNLDIYRKWAQEEALSGRDLFYYGRELYYHKLYAEAETVLEKMLAGEGWYVNKIEACKVLAACYRETADPARELSALFRTFQYGESRASVLCEIADALKKAQRYREAIFWLEAALLCRDHTAEGDFEMPECRTIIPLLELVWLYHAVGDHAKSLEYHKKSEAIAPDHPSVMYNQNYFGE